MIKLKIFAALIFIFGLLLFVFGIELLVTLDRDIQLLEAFQKGGTPDINLPMFRTIVITSAICYVVVGLLSLISGIGLFLLKNWARMLWLGVLFLLAGINLYALVSQYQRDTLGAENLIVQFIIGVVIVGMWLYFNNRKTKNLFQRSVIESAV